MTPKEYIDAHLRCIGDVKGDDPLLFCPTAGMYRSLLADSQALRDLLAALPPCYCGAPATWRTTFWHKCDAHAQSGLVTGELPYADVVRRVQP